MMMSEELIANVILRQICEYFLPVATVFVLQFGLVLNLSALFFHRRFFISFRYQARISRINFIKLRKARQTKFVKMEGAKNTFDADDLA